METQTNKLQFVIDYLHAVTNRSEVDVDTFETMGNILAGLKKEAVLAKDEFFAKQIWCYESILSIQHTYLRAYLHMKTGSYYEAWCLLERIEINIETLEKHYVFSDSDEFKIEFIDKHIRQFQTLFPYKLFVSPGMIAKSKSCSICGASVSIRDSCGHRLGEIYGGELCCRLVNEAIPIEISFVTEPVQKQSVVFLGNSEGRSIAENDHYNYGVVEYVIRGLQSPFDAWETKLTKTRHPHTNFSDKGRNSPCPCDSGKKYKQCCLKESGVLMPHREFHFSVPPPKELPEIVYHY